MKRSLGNCLIKTVPDKGKGVFAKNNFKTEEVVVRGRIIRRVPKRTNYSFQVGIKKHIDLDIPARLINHSCDPNLGIKNNVFGGYDFVAMRSIKKGEELCWDYCMSEYHSIAVKRCLCGSKNCRRRIRGFKYLPEKIKAKYKGFTGGYLNYEGK